MKKLALFLISLIAVGTSAAATPAAYQDATLKSFHTIASGQHCSGNTSGKVSENGDVDASNSTTCSDTTTAQYTILIGDQTLVISPARSGKSSAGAIFSLGYSTLFEKDSCLYGQLPGAHILIRSENGKYRVKVGKRESLYKLVAAQ